MAPRAPTLAATGSMIVRWIHRGLIILVGAIGCLLAGLAGFAFLTHSEVTLYGSDIMSPSGSSALDWRRTRMLIRDHRIAVICQFQQADFGTTRPTVSDARTNVIWTMGSNPYNFASPPASGFDAFGVRYHSWIAHREPYRVDRITALSAHPATLAIAGSLLLAATTYATLRSRRRARITGFEIVSTHGAAGRE